MDALIKLLLAAGTPLLAKVIAAKFGSPMGDVAGTVLADIGAARGVGADAGAITGAITADPSGAAERLAPVEQNTAALLLAETEKIKAETASQQASNDLIEKEMDKGPLWSWAWLPAWQWFLMFLWGWTVVLVPILNAVLRRMDDFTGMPTIDFGTLLTLTGLFLGLHMGGHTVLELMRGGIGGLLGGKANGKADGS